jgi:hypothetical protein
VVRLGGLRHPVVDDTLTGLIPYHWHDNAFDHYDHLMAFVECYSALRPRLRRGEGRTVHPLRHAGRLKTA